MGHEEVKVSGQHGKNLRFGLEGGFDCFSADVGTWEYMAMIMIQQLTSVGSSFSSYKVTSSKYSPYSATS